MKSFSILRLKASLIVSILFLSLPQSTFAEEIVEKAQEKQAEQTKIEDVKKKEQGKWYRNLAFGYSRTDGNSDTSLLSTDLKLDYEKEKNIWNFDASHRTGENDNQTTIDETRALGEYKRLITERLYFGANTTAERDDIADVKYRIIPGATLGYFFVKNDDMRFSLEAGPSYVFEKVGNTKDEYFSPRIADRFEYDFSETAKFFQYAEILLSTDDSDNYIVNAEAGIQARLTDMMSLIVSVIDNYDNVPAPGRKKNDVAIITSLGLNF